MMRLNRSDSALHDDVIIKVIGVGGGGDNAVNHMYEQGIKKVSFVVCNTDRQALNNSIVPNRLLIGPTVTGGLGAGNDPEKARLAAEESADEIARLFDDETKMVFITAGMGGGTGTGAGPVVARIAQEKGLLTIGTPLCATAARPSSRRVMARGNTVLPRPSRTR